jgi:hypothetical membrane protein
VTFGSGSVVVGEQTMEWEVAGMNAVSNADSCGDVISRGWRGRTAKKSLLLAGVAAVVVYAIGDVLSGLFYDGYSYLNQAISELSAFGSPVRPLMVTVILIHNVLLLAFGIGLLRVAQRRSVWWIGALLVAEFVLVGIPTHTFWAMSSRNMATGFNDTMHIATSAVFGLLMVAMMVLSAVAYRGWFRLYSLATMVVVIGFGMASSFAIRGIEQNDTPWAGGFERINAYAYFAWLVILAVMAIRHELGSSQTEGDLTGSRPEVPIAA